MSLVPLSLSLSLSRARVERVVSVLRVVLAAMSLFAIWIDPSEPAQYAETVYGLHIIYVVYAIGIAAVMWSHRGGGRMPMATLVVDIIVASVFQQLTLGTSSPFFVYFVFAVFSSALRWGWRGTAWTSAAVIVAYMVMGIWLSLTIDLNDFEFNHLMVRLAYLLVAAVSLIYLGQHEERLRSEMQRLADWPSVAAHGAADALGSTLAHACSVVGAASATLVWSTDDEPWSYITGWPGSGTVRKLPPDRIEPLVPEPLESSAFWCVSDITAVDVVDVHRGRALFWRGSPVHKTIAARLPGEGLASAPFRTADVSGRVFFSGVRDIGPDIMPLVEVVSREIGAGIDQRAAHERAQRLAVSEDRIRLARDLHDGVLQSLTGIRLELQNLAQEAVDVDGEERLRALERALAIQQRELRSFIEDLRPAPETDGNGSLAARLEQLRRRLAIEWRTSITMRVGPIEGAVSPVVDREVPLMVHEAIVNALKHGHPSRVSVDLRAADGDLQVVVADDGGGFPFEGRLSGPALATSPLAPVSLRERVAALGGAVAIESGPTGARVELLLPLGDAHE